MTALESLARACDQVLVQAWHMTVMLVWDVRAGV